MQDVTSRLPEGNNLEILTIKYVDMHIKLPVVMHCSKKNPENVEKV
jgi:hypothetical protein